MIRSALFLTQRADKSKISDKLRKFIDTILVRSCQVMIYSELQLMSSLHFGMR